MKVFVTGGTGFIGSHLLKALTLDGQLVTCYLRKSVSGTYWVKELPITAQYNLHNLRKYDIIYHNAGVLGSNNVRYDEYRRVHVDMLKVILDRMRSDATLVLTSSAFVSQPKPNSAYEQTKLIAEELLQESNKKYSIVRPGFVYGPRDMHLLPLFKSIKRYNRLFPIQGGGHNLVCPTYVDDVVTTLMKAPYRLNKITEVSGTPIAMKDFLGTIAKVLNVPKPFIPMIPLYKMDFFCRERVFNRNGETTDLVNGLEKTVGWYKDNGYL